MSLTTDPQGAAEPKLPWWDTIWLSYSTYFEFFGDVMRISWLWLVVCIPLTGIAGVLQWTWMSGVFGQMISGQPRQTLDQFAMPTDILLVVNASGLVMTLAGVSIAVAWHRRLILGEHPQLSGSNVVTKNLWRYVLIGLAIALSVLIPVLAIMLIIIPVVVGAAIPAFALLIIVPLYVAAAAVVLRLCLLLPARAVGDVGLTFKETWRRTRGNTWRLFWGLLACTLPPMLVAQVVYLSFVGFPDPRILFSAGEALAGRMAVTSMVFVAYYLLILPIMIGFLSLSYRHFFAPAGIPAQPAGQPPR